MLGDFGEVYVLDWGIAKIMDSDDDEDGVPLALRSAEAAVRPSVGRPPTAPHSVLGTLAYAAPEQMAAGQHVDARSDEFALGAILFELLTWQRARPSAAPEEMMKAIQQAPDSRSSTRVPVQAVPLELVAIYERAMEHAPEDRYASVKAMIVDLERFLRSDKAPDLLRELARQQQRTEQEHLALASTEPMPNWRRSVSASALAETESGPGWPVMPAPRPRRTEQPVAEHAPVEPPGPLPREVTQALIGDALRREQGRLRTVAVVGVALVFLALLAVTMRVRDWTLVGVLCLAGVTSSGLRIWNLVEPESRRLPYAVHTASLIFFALLARIFGALPFLALPVALDTSLHAGSPLRGFRRFAILSSCALLLGTVGLEWLGLIEPSALFQGGSMMLLPTVVELTPGATGSVLLILSLMTVAVPALSFGQRTSLLSEHERQLKLTEWQLAQTLPHEALLQTSRESRRRLG